MLSSSLQATICKTFIVQQTIIMHTFFCLFFLTVSNVTAFKKLVDPVSKNVCISAVNSLGIM